MEKELITVSEYFNISEKEVRIIYDIIQHFFATNTYQDLKILLIKVFHSDIRPEHYIILGHLIGYCLATEEAQATQSNYLSICQRQN